MTTISGIPATLVAILRHANANGYALMRSTAFGVSDWAWTNTPARRKVHAMRLGGGGWQVTVHGKGHFFPDTVAELADILVAVGYLPEQFRTGYDTVAELEREAGMFSKHWANAVDMLKACRAELGSAKARISAAVNVQVWTNEDGRRFVFADDLLAALDPESAPAAAAQPDEAQIRERLARHGLTEHGMAAQVEIVRSGLDTLDNLDAAFDRLHANIHGHMFVDGAWQDGPR